MIDPGKTDQYHPEVVDKLYIQYAQQVVPSYPVVVVVIVAA